MVAQHRGEVRPVVRRATQPVDEQGWLGVVRSCGRGPHMDALFAELDVSTRPHLRVFARRKLRIG
jgi:hypothetical protein